jgi:hypothetical protein
MTKLQDNIESRMRYGSPKKYGVDPNSIYDIKQGLRKVWLKCLNGEPYNSEEFSCLREALVRKIGEEKVMEYLAEIKAELK